MNLLKQVRALVASDQPDIAALERARAELAEQLAADRATLAAAQAARREVLGAIGDDDAVDAADRALAEALRRVDRAAAALARLENEIRAAQDRAQADADRAQVAEARAILEECKRLGLERARCRGRVMEIDRIIGGYRPIVARARHAAKRLGVSPPNDPEWAADQGLGK